MRDVSDMNRKSDFRFSGANTADNSGRSTEESSSNSRNSPSAYLNHTTTRPSAATGTNLPAPSSALSPLLSSTLGVLFLSCPHTGSSLASSLSGPLYPLLLPSAELHALRRHSPALLRLKEDFVSLCLRRRVACLSVAETVPQPLFGRQVRFVERDSADAGVGRLVAVEETHLGVCKPRDRDSEVYRLVVEFVREVCAQL